MQKYSVYCIAVLRKPVCVTKTSRKCLLKCPPCVIAETEGVKISNCYFTFMLVNYMCETKTLALLLTLKSLHKNIAFPLMKSKPEMF